MNPASAIRGPTWLLRFYFSISQDRGLQVVRTPRGFLPSKIQIWTTTSDSLSAVLVLTRAPVCVEAFDRGTRVCVRSATVINHLQTAVVQCVSRHQNLVAWERAIVATHVVSRALCRGLNAPSFVTFRVIQDCSFDRWCSPRDLPKISIRYLRTREASNDGRTRVPSEFPFHVRAVANLTLMKAGQAKL